MDFLGITFIGWGAIVIALSMAILAGIMFILGRERVHHMWGIFCLATSLWAATFYVVTLISEPEAAIVWWKITYVSIIIIPFTFFHFVLEFINSAHLNKFKSLILSALYATLLILLYVDLTTNLIIGGVKFLFNELYYAQPGIFHPYFTVLYFGLVTYSYYLVYREYKLRRDDRLFRQRVGYFIFATVFGFTGASMNFFPVYGIEIHPSTNLAVVIGSSFVAFAILRYRLFDIRVVTAQFLTLILGALTFFQLIVSDTAPKIVFNSLLLLITLAVGVYLILSVRKEVQQREQIERLAKDLEAANERLKELDQLKSEFVSLATHQIRGPLTTIKGYASMLLEGDYGKVPEEIRPPVETIFQSSSSLAVIVQDFLDVSRIEQGKMKYEFSNFNISKLVEAVATELGPNIEKKGLALTLEIEPNITIHADAGKVRQVVENLFDNAQKYTLQGRIQVMVEKREGKAVISVSDTGAGISKETLPKLFQKFSRAEDASKANIKGTGLGLYVARQLIEAQGGTIRAESEGEGKGAAFTVELPLKT